MGLIPHEILHITASILAGLIVWKLYKKLWTSLIAAFFGGVLIDLDHLIDYYFAFGPTFDLYYFTQGYQFLKSGKVYILFHGWEYAFALLVIFIFIRHYKILASVILAFTLAMITHLTIDTLTNEMYFKSYFIVKRARVNFDMQKLVPASHYENDLKERLKIFLKDLKK